jgi:hypothetical protein
MKTRLAAALGLLLVLCPPARPLEKTSVPAPDRSGAWNAGLTCTISYFNTCTGWIWAWGGWELEDWIGVAFESCCSSKSAVLNTSSLFIYTAAPSGRGFTGVIAVHEADENLCPTGAPLASQFFLPLSGWNTYAWGIDVPSTFVVLARAGSPLLPSPLSFATDHPAVGPTGPPACGTCYPTTRLTRSFYYGTVDSPACPGAPLNDGVCNAELLWNAQLTCGTVSVDDQSWGSIKKLYR